MYGHHHPHQQQQQHQQQGPVTAPPSVPGAATPRGFFTPDLPVSHHPSLPRIDNAVLTYLNDVTTPTSNGQSVAQLYSTRLYVNLAIGLHCVSKRSTSPIT